ncbi:MAG: polyphosphate kinase 2 family protein [Deltaproteobacteria bacterium]|nr:polyphosphate kinase 2 family protein [Deltaproteobacteria bacterium]
MRDRAYAHLVDGARKVRLDRFDPADTAGLEKEAALAELEKLGEEFAELGSLLSYAGQHALLVVLQGRDASGKDGAIRKILDFSNVLNVRVAPFKAPSESERAHDFLWRVHQVVPERGHTALFNRSHYEDVIAARVHALVPEPVWKKRYEHINDFERLLADNNVILLKFCLHVSLDERIERLIAREKDARTAWKLNPQDWRELPLSEKLDEAYEDVLNKCSSSALPWYVVPADKKWFRNLAIMQQLVFALRPYKKVWVKKLELMGRDAMKEIRGLRAQASHLRKAGHKAASGRR